jgi:hypothetical protein
MRGLAISVIAIAAIALSGCSNGSSNSGNSEPTVPAEGTGRQTLESAIRSQLPDQLREATGRVAFVSQVVCVSTGARNQYECVAKVSQAGPGGGLVRSSLGITGTCDERACTWRVGEG